MATQRSRSRSPPHGGMQIFVTKLNGARVALDVEPSDTVINVKLKIEEKWGHRPLEQRLHLGSRVLSDTDARSLSDLSIGDKAELSLLVREVGRIIVKTLTGQTVTFDVKAQAPSTPPPESTDTMAALGCNWLQEARTALSRAMWCGIDDDFVEVPEFARRP